MPKYKQYSTILASNFEQKGQENMTSYNLQYWPVTMAVMKGLIIIKLNMAFIYDVQRNKPEYTPVQVNNESVSQVKTFKYPGVLLSDDMIWSDHVG